MFTIMCAFFIVGKKQDVWYAIDPETGQKKQRLSMDGLEQMCPHNIQDERPQFYLGRTGMKDDYLFLYNMYILPIEYTIDTLALMNF